LIRAQQAIASLTGANADQTAGINIVRRALEEPARCIAFNAGDSADVIISEIKSKLGNYGYNAADGTYGDMVEQGVIDPTKVTKTALINAGSIAGLILTTDCSIAQLPPKEGAQQPQMGGMPGMM
jgi:chaperonin GroEL